MCFLCNTIHQVRLYKRHVITTELSSVGIDDVCVCVWVSDRVYEMNLKWKPKCVVAVLLGCLSRLCVRLPGVRESGVFSTFPSRKVDVESQHLFIYWKVLLMWRYFSLIAPFHVWLSVNVSSVCLLDLVRDHTLQSVIFLNCTHENFVEHIKTVF